MEEITVGQIVAGIAIITAIIVFGERLYNIYKTQLLDKFKQQDEKNEKQDNEISQLILRVEKIEKENEATKVESKLLLKSIQACLEGLKEQGCDGSVTTAIQEIDKYLLEVSH